jgi:hypothetical protein
MNFLLTSLLVSQNLFARVYGGTNSDNAQSITLTTDSGYAIAGGTRSFGAGQSDLIVVRMDKAGNIIWARTFGGDTSDWAQSIIQTADGGFVVAGNTLSFGAGSGDILILRVDASGNLSWVRTLGGMNSEEAKSVIQTADGGFLVVGSTSSFGVGNGDLLALKLSSSGNLEWAKAYGTTNLEGATSVIQTPYGGYVIGGYIEQMLTDVLVLRINPSGDLMWTRAFEGPWYESANSIAQVLDGGYVVAGGSDSWFLHSQDFQVIKIDTSGNMEWTRIYGDTTYSERALSIISIPDGGLIFVGYQWISGPNIVRLLLVKTDSFGGVVLARMFGDTGIQVPFSVIQAFDESYVIAGGIGSTLGINNILVMKLDTAGGYPDCLIPYMPLSRSVSPTVIIPSLAVTVCTLAIDTPDLTITAPTLTITDFCPPVVTEDKNRLS